ncbi:hypothetical protein EVAR_711_1 [Eumeta japonica]|uniref:Uncharacterized protein n=1 Tax=Eumeta variegata TaxID=151549 RepID=A0A4C1SBS8_EUMVA|nr:hypothetical protein EVAR_711_1 [Eumeta japonica]
MGPTRVNVPVTSCTERIPLRDPSQGKSSDVNTLVCCPAASGEAEYCTPTAVYEIRAIIKKSDHMKTLPMLMPCPAQFCPHTARNLFSEATVRDIRGSGLRDDS